MSNPHAERWRRAHEAFVDRSDLSVFEEMFDSEVEWRAWNDEGNCHNRNEAMETIRAAINAGVPLEMPEFIGTGDKFVLIPRLEVLPSFFPRDAEGLFQVIEMKDDKITRIQDFTRRDQALAAAGL